MGILITVVNDFDGYFEHRTRTILNKVNNPKIKEVQVHARPYTPNALEYGWVNESEGILYILWYSAIRAGFGVFNSEMESELITELNNL